MLTPKEVMESVYKALDSKKAKDIKVLETQSLTVLADYFVICTAGSSTQIKTLADELGKTMKDLDEAPLRTEGYRAGGWLLVDFGCVVVHIFLQEMREFYNLEHLWADAVAVDTKYLTEVE